MDSFDTSTPSKHHHTYYNISVEIHPEDNFIKVVGVLNLQASYQTTTTLELLLHKQLTIQSFSGKQVSDYSFNLQGKSPIPFVPDARPLHIHFKNPIEPGKTTQIEYSYQGKITSWPAYSCNVIAPDWVELGMYFPWYPMLVNLSQKITFDLEVICPPGWMVAGYGEFQRVSQGWKGSWHHPTQDMVVVASPTLFKKQYHHPKGKIILFTSTFSREAARQLGDNSLFALSSFTDWFRPVSQNNYSIIQSARRKGGGYGRRGLVVLGGVDEKDFLNRPEVYLRYLAHEIAHAWWWKAPVETWHDWLNEGFAEISAQLLVAERFGQEIYHRNMETKRQTANGLGPLWGFDRFDQDTPEKQERCEKLLYARGPVILHDLRNQIGCDPFLALCRRFLRVEKPTTQNFIAIIQEMFGNSLSQWLEEQLKMV